MKLLEKIEEWWLNHVYKNVLRQYSTKKDIRELDDIQNFLKACDISITDYTNCDEISTTLGLRITYENKDFFFYEHDNKSFEGGARRYTMKYDGCGVGCKGCKKIN